MLLAVCVLHENKVLFGKFLTRLHYKRDFIVLFSDIVDTLHDETRNLFKSIDHKQYKISYYFDFERKLIFIFINEIYDNTDSIQGQISELYGFLIEIYKKKSSYIFDNQELSEFELILENILKIYNQKMTKLDFYDIPIKRPFKKPVVETKPILEEIITENEENIQETKEESEIIDENEEFDSPIDVVLVSRNDGKFLVSVTFNKQLDSKLFSAKSMGPEGVKKIQEILIEMNLDTLVVSKGNLLLTAIYQPRLTKEQIESQALEALNSFERLYDADSLDEWDGDVELFSSFKNVLESQFGEFMYYIENPEEE